MLVPYSLVAVEVSPVAEALPPASGMTRALAHLSLLAGCASLTSRVKGPFSVALYASTTRSQSSVALGLRVRVSTPLVPLPMISVTCPLQPALTPVEVHPDEAGRAYRAGSKVGPGVTLML